MSGLRERKKAETRSALSWAAVQLTVKHGYHNVRVEEIAAAAGVSPRTFNNYYSSKAEAIVARHLDRAVRIADDLRERPADEPLWDALTAAVLAQFRRGPEVERMPVTDHREWAAGLELMLAEPALQAEMLRVAAVAEEHLAAAIAERTGTDLDTDLYPHLVAAAVSAATNAASRHFVRTGSKFPMEQLLPEALSRLAAGLPTP